MENKRKSNMELLRIVAMFMIICFHLYYHTVWVQLTDKASIERTGNGLFCHPLFYKRLLLLSTMAPLGRAGNVIFIMISGYFMASKGRKINLAKISTKLLTQQLFAAVVLTTSSTIIWKALKTKYIKLIDFNYFNGMSWFVGYYFLVILIAYLFLNNFLEKLDKRQYITFLLVMFGITQFSWPNTLVNNLVNNIENSLNIIFVGIFAYALGGAIARFDLFGKIKWPFLYLSIIASFILVYWSTYNVVNLKIEEYSRNQSTDMFIQTLPVYRNNNLICIVIGVALFEIFKRIDIGSNKVINYIASSTLMVYLLHDNGYVYSIWDTQDWITLLKKDALGFIGKYLLWALATFAIGIALYLVYVLIGKWINSYIKKTNSAENEKAS